MNASADVTLDLGGLTQAERFALQWQYGLLGEFHAALARAISLADDSNLRRLRTVYPSEVAGFLNYRDANWWQRVRRKAGIES